MNDDASKVFLKHSFNIDLKYSTQIGQGNDRIERFVRLETTLIVYQFPHLNQTLVSDK